MLCIFFIVFKRNIEFGKFSMRKPKAKPRHRIAKPKPIPTKKISKSKKLPSKKK